MQLKSMQLKNSVILKFKFYGQLHGVTKANYLLNINVLLGCQGRVNVVQYTCIA